MRVIEVNPRKPIVIITWEGTAPEQKSIILNSHMDVVPVYPERWTHAPFGAEMDHEGRIYARGAQDMKCVGMQFLAAIRAMRRDGVRLKRTIHATFVPDEEIGGKLGMMEWVHKESFRELNAGFSIDEGIAGEGETYPLFYGERSVWRKQSGTRRWVERAVFNRVSCSRCFASDVYFNISGTPGHGSLLLKGTAGQKAHYIIDKLMRFRENEVKRLENNPDFTIGDVTTVNITLMKVGLARQRLFGWAASAASLTLTAHRCGASLCFPLPQTGRCAGKRGPAGAVGLLRHSAGGRRQPSGV